MKQSVNLLLLLYTQQEFYTTVAFWHIMKIIVSKLTVTFWGRMKKNIELVEQRFS